MRRLPPLAAVRAFEAAARTENFTSAAAELGMTQAAVSYQVKSLEERLGAPLFVRERGRVRLTPLGGRLLPALTGAFDAIEAAFASHRAEDESLLTVTTTHTFANTWLAWGYLVVFGSMVAFSAYVWLLGNAPISLVATYAYVNPVVAVVLGALILDEPITSAVLVGGAVIVAAVAIVITAERVRRPVGTVPTDEPSPA